MSFLIMLSELLTPTALIFLVVFLLLSEKLRRELALMYLSFPKPKQFYKEGMNKTWKLNNIAILSIAISLIVANIVVRYDEVNKRINTPPPVVEVVKEKPAISMNPEVFYYCLNSAKNKEGLKAEVINACKEAAVITLAPSEDKVKYTLSKRDVVF